MASASGAPAVPGGSAFGVTPQDVQAAAASANATAANIAAELSALRVYVVSLEGQWRGIAADAFSALMTDYDTYSQMLHDALTDIASGLQGNYVNYADTEQQNISNLTSVNGTIPGGNFS